RRTCPAEVLGAHRGGIPALNRPVLRCPPGHPGGHRPTRGGTFQSRVELDQVRFRRMRAREISMRRSGCDGRRSFRRLVRLGRSGLRESTGLRLDAFKVYCDEGYHALYSLDLAEQVATTTGISIPDWDFGGFAARLDTTAEELLPGEPVLAQLLQAVVFETLITGVLNELPNDTSVITTVRELARDHARDEGRHHRFFARFFHELWTNLDTDLRVRVALAMPALIEDCLTWDVHPVARSLAAAGLP